jgi:hypothetical protein
MHWLNARRSEHVGSLEGKAQDRISGELLQDVYDRMPVIQSPSPARHLVDRSSGKRGGTEGNAGIL